MKNDLTKTVFGNQLNKLLPFHESLRILDEMGLLNIGELAEKAISKKSGVAQCKKLTENIDLVSGVQIKHAKTHLRGSQEYRYWMATITRNTTAPILAVITEQCTRKQYFLYIPYSAHKHLQGNTINISFGSDGTKTNCHWLSRHRVSSFKELCALAR
jgi:hypothetical protein